MIHTYIQTKKRNLRIETQIKNLISHRIHGTHLIINKKLLKYMQG